MKCGHCDTTISYLKATVTKTRNGSNTWRAVAHCCPSCGAVLGAEVDPLAVRAEVVSGVVMEIKKLLRR